MNYKILKVCLDTDLGIFFLIMNDTLNSISKTHKRIYLEKHRNILDA